MGRDPPLLSVGRWASVLVGIAVGLALLLTEVIGSTTLPGPWFPCSVVRRWSVLLATVQLVLDLTVLAVAGLSRYCDGIAVREG